MKKTTLKCALITALIFTSSFAVDNPAFAKSNANNSVMFDDFSYKSFSEAASNGWLIRTETGHPGIKNGVWWTEGVTFHPDITNSNNQVMRITSKTDGTSVNTRQTQVCHQRKYLEGTYAARVHFNDEPDYGVDGDGVVQTFYAISPLEKPLDKDYSETDFEYLPNGGWGEENNALFATSWETFQLTPWTPINEHNARRGSLQGWHVLVLTIIDNTLNYYVDGELFATHSSQVYPEVPMSINFNLWFIAEQIVTQQTMRQYSQDIDWVYFEAKSKLDTKTVLNKVEMLRKQDSSFTDTVPAGNYAAYCSL
ncbi:glycoside hydrolase family 16 protein [Pseudoalteromonas xiamenensis]